MNFKKCVLTLLCPLCLVTIIAPTVAAKSKVEAKPLAKKAVAVKRAAKPVEKPKAKPMAKAAVHPKSTVVAVRKIGAAPKAVVRLEAPPQAEDRSMSPDAVYKSCINADPKK